MGLKIGINTGKLQLGRNLFQRPWLAGRIKDGDSGPVPYVGTIALYGLACAKAVLSNVDVLVNRSLLILLPLSRVRLRGTSADGGVQQKNSLIFATCSVLASHAPVDAGLPPVKGR